jgi:hypothetical protein
MKKFTISGRTSFKYMTLIWRIWRIWRMFHSRTGFSIDEIYYDAKEEFRPRKAMCIHNDVAE